MNDTAPAPNRDESQSATRELYAMTFWLRRTSGEPIDDQASLCRVFRAREGYSTNPTCSVMKSGTPRRLAHDPSKVVEYRLPCACTTSHDRSAAHAAKMPGPTGVA